MCFPLVVWGSVFVFVVHYFVSFLVLHHHEEEERAGCFAFNVLQMSCYSICSVTLPHGAVGWSALCDCGISLSYSLFGRNNP